MEQDGRIAELGPGAMAFSDCTHPYPRHFDHAFEQLVVRVPRDEALAVAGIREPPLVTARALSRVDVDDAPQSARSPQNVRARPEPAGNGHHPGATFMQFRATFQRESTMTRNHQNPADYFPYYY